VCDHCGCRAFEPIADLTVEHKEILRLAWEVAEDPVRDGDARLEVRDRLVALLDRHVLKEEIGLYPRLLETADLSDEHVLVLEDEHRAIRRALVDATFDRRDFYALAAHIEEEELELFSSAMLSFDEDVWERLWAVHREAGVAPSTSHAHGSHAHTH
jgi:hemerythrin-like domain-containing protein